MDRSVRTCRTLAACLVDPVRVDVVFGDGFSVGGEDSDVAVVDVHEDVFACVRSSDGEVAEFPGVAQGDFAGLVDAVRAGCGTRRRRGWVFPQVWL